jgi:hypothetical protein
MAGTSPIFEDVGPKKNEKTPAIVQGSPSLPYLPEVF